MRTVSKSPLGLAGVAALAAVLGGCMSPTTYGTGVSPGKQTLNDISGLVSFTGKQGPAIDYTPRPPIVTPPVAGALPEPGTTAATAAVAWPTDPDVAARQQAAAKAAADGHNHLAPPDSRAFVRIEDPGWRPPKNNRAARPDPDYDSSKAALDDFNRARKSTQQIQSAMKADGTMAVDADGNPVRRVLSEPPTSYRVPDPEAPDAFTATAKKAKKWWWPF